MDGYHFYPNPAKTSWSLVAGSMWLRLRVVATTGAIVALTELSKGEIGVVAGLAWIFGGAWVATLSWRRFKVLLDEPDEAAEAVTPATTPTLPATHRSWDRRETGPSSAFPPVGS